ncbi:manganese efflux pump MntP family protein [Paenibacillus protaetiae]|uniref:Putative manganese efflux pump MntP n=1 Tax=Paenibacillus protaetiae TaxID=2509456 RepID=A0A4P6EYR6_9BACL|nr:manganese efflux pump [Paenibacillus protaetiae]QAY68570.1 manganese efflux pump [Paenibacillus protaetiae]
MAAGQLFTLLLMAAALGMDAFSLGIGIGLRGIRLKHILRLSLIIALFHVLMPLAGIWMGKLVGALLGHIASMAAGALLLLLGGHMIYNSLRGEQVRPVDTRTLWGTLVLALSVSVDSFSVGISLGVFAADVAVTVLAFGFFGGLMSIMGLMLGRRAGRNLGEYGEACGGAILLLFGILFMI